MNFLSRIRTPGGEAQEEQEERPRPRARMIGEILRDRREELGLDLDSIGEALRIKASYLAALEQGRSHELPGPAYAIGFVRAYSHHLGFDSEKVLARFRTESSELQARPDLSLPVPLGERSLPGAAVLVVGLILALCGYGTWYYLSTGERSRPERVAAVPADLRPPVPPPAAATAPPPALPRPSSAAPQSATPSPKQPSTAGGNMVSGLFANSTGSPAPEVDTNPTPAPPTASTAASSSPPAPADTVVGSSKDAPKAQLAYATDAAGGNRVAIKALTDCWIQVRGPDQSILFSRVLKSGEVYPVPAKPGLSLRTGNAGALEIAVDGKSVPSIGAIGTLRRNVALDPDALLGGTAVHG